MKSVYSVIAELCLHLDWALGSQPESTKKAKATRSLAQAQKLVSDYQERCKQPTLFGDSNTDPRRKHRKNDKDTAVAAAHVNIPGRRTQCWKLLHQICLYPWEGLTNEEAHDRCPDICYDSSTTRMSELEDGGWIVNSGRKRKSRYGVDQVVWQPTLKALSHPELMGNGDQPPGINFSL